MRRTIKKKTKREEPNKTENIRFNKNIQKEIRIRRQFNKKKRRKKAESKTEKFQDLYLKQKIKIQELVTEAVKKQEEKETKEIMNNQNSNKKMKTLGKHQEVTGYEKESKSIEIYDENLDKVTQTQRELQQFLKLYVRSTTMTQLKHGTLK